MMEFDIYSQLNILITKLDLVIHENLQEIGFQILQMNMYLKGSGYIFNFLYIS